MMDWEDVRVQLVDTPPITADYLESWQASMVQTADAALLLVDVGDDDGAFAAQAVSERLAAVKTMLVSQKPAEADPTVHFTRTFLVANKIDLPDAELRLEMVRELFGERFAIHAVAAEHGTGLEELRNAIYQFLNVLRVYTKKPGKPPDMESPFTCPRGSTLLELASLVHRDFADNLKSARIWGTGVYDGQTVTRDHIMHDKDVVELHV
jgi:ribosome-interacting GTPase 1